MNKMSQLKEALKKERNARLIESHEKKFGIKVTNQESYLAWHKQKILSLMGYFALVVMLFLVVVMTQIEYNELAKSIVYYGFNNNLTVSELVNILGGG